MARLEISKVVTGDKGEYRAVARNKHGEGVATINLNFDGSDKPKYISIIFPIGFDHNTDFINSEMFFSISFSNPLNPFRNWQFRQQ